MANLQGHNEPVAWKCANCGNTSDCQGVGQGDNWCNSCAVCGQMQPLYAAPPAAPAPAAPAAPVPDGWVMVPREPTPEMLAVVRNGPMHETWTEGYCAMIAASPAAPAAPVVREPLTDEQIWSMWMSSEFRGNGGQADWFCEGIRAAEAHHGITGGKP